METSDSSTRLQSLVISKQPTEQTIIPNNQEKTTVYPTKRLRNYSEYKFWLVGSPEAEIVCSILPSARQTIRLFLHLMEEMGPPGSGRWSFVRKGKAKAKAYNITFLGVVASKTLESVSFNR